MGKLAFVFAGQGAQAVGMGKELAENFPIADKTFDEASEALGFDIKDMIWNGDSETLMITENTQPTIVTMSVAALRVLQEKGIKPDVVAGLSLGEYTAHIASGSMEFADGVRLVKKRGKYMQEEVPVGKGAMAAIIALSAEDVIACCEEASKSVFVHLQTLTVPAKSLYRVKLRQWISVVNWQRKRAQNVL